MVKGFSIIVYQWFFKTLDNRLKIVLIICAHSDLRCLLIPQTTSMMAKFWGCRKADKLSASTLVGQLGVSCSFDWLIKVNKNLWAFLSNVPCIKVIWFGIFLWPVEKMQFRQKSITKPFPPPLYTSIKRRLHFLQYFLWFSILY